MEARTAFSRQPARILLVDINNDLDLDIIQNLHHSLEQFFAVICNLTGPVRVPFFGLFALGNYPEALFPLQNVRGNFSRLQSAIDELKSFHADSIASKQPNSSSVHGSVAQGIMEAINMFKRQSQGLLQTAGYWSQLELCVMTASNPILVNRQIEKALKQVNIDTLKKVGLVCINNPDRLHNLYDDLLAQSQNSSHSDTSSNSEATGVVEVCHIEHDNLSIENYFRSWLHDVATDKEHLHVIMPPVDSDESLVLKCDIQERLLNPVQTSYVNFFIMQTDGSTSKSTPGGFNKASANNVPVYVLKVIKTISTEGVCESVLYGMPLLVKATTCWKIDWDELETNQQNFQGLCHILQQKNECLLVKLEKNDKAAVPNQKSRQKSNFRYNVPSQQPNGHFLLLPSNSGSLLLKSIAVRELMLPYEYQPVQTPDDGILHKIQTSLEQIESEEMYNPLLYQSSLGTAALNQQQQQRRNTQTSGHASFKALGNYGVKNMAQNRTSTSTASAVRSTTVQSAGKRKVPAACGNSVRMSAFDNRTNTVSVNNGTFNSDTTASKQPRYRNQQNMFYSARDDFPTKL